MACEAGITPVVCVLQVSSSEEVVCVKPGGGVSGAVTLPAGLTVDTVNSAGSLDDAVRKVGLDW